MVLSATASAAAAAGAAFHPVLPELMPRLQRCLAATDDAGLKVRARALERAESRDRAATSARAHVVRIVVSAFRAR